MKLKHIFFFIAPFLFVCCQCKNKAPETKVAPSQNTSISRDLNETNSHSKSIFNNKNVEELFNQYLALKAVLVNSNAEQSKEVASQLAVFAEKQFPNSKIVAIINQIKAQDELKKQRVYFEDLSKEIASLLETELQKGIIYKQFCPMAFEGKGAFWFSNSKEIRNPYYGDEMLTCGYVQKTIEK